MGIKDINLLHKVEFEGFLKAQYQLLEELTSETKFNFEYIKRIHFLALKDIYSFAGKLRHVNMTKANFLFPTAKFLPQICHDFDLKILSTIKKAYNSKEELIKSIATVHAELLYIHPFREANGRVARVLANMMAIKQGCDFLNFYKITERQFHKYVQAVQAAAMQDYQPMNKIIV